MTPFRLALEATEELLGRPRAGLVFQLSALVLLLQAFEAGSPTLAATTSVTCGAILISPFLRRRAESWFLVCAVLAVFFARNWFLAPNHHFLIALWCLACALAASSDRPVLVLAHNGRMLIGMAFLLAVVWKLRSPDYLDGSFMEYSILTGVVKKFSTLASLLTGISPHHWAVNQAVEEAFLASPARESSEPLQSALDVRWMAVLVTWWALLFELAVAVAFLVRRPRRVARARDGMLLVFLYTVYPFLPITQFAHALAVMGFAQCPGVKRRTRAAYLVSFPVLQIARMPWESWLVRFLGT